MICDTVRGRQEVYIGQVPYDSCKKKSKYKLDLVAVQVRWDRGGIEQAGEYSGPLTEVSSF
jgi:hypothetical protein